VHAANTVAEPGGSMRTVLKGSISYAGKEFGPGDWFFIPNGIPYSFKTDEYHETVVMYKYAFFAVVRFWMIFAAGQPMFGHLTCP
jgi:hypothetical protein